MVPHLDVVINRGVGPILTHPVVPGRRESLLGVEDDVDTPGIFTMVG